MELGHRIKQLRRSKHLTQEQLVSGLFDRSYLSQIETGKLIPPLDTIKLIAERLDVSVHSLISEQYENLNLSRICKQLMNTARATNDQRLMRQAWEAAFNLNSLKLMCDVILTWYRILRTPTFEFQHALFETVNCGIKEESDFSAYWDVLLCVGNTYFKSSLYNQAIVEFKRLIDKHPPVEIEFRALINLGSTLLEKGNFGDAHLAFMQAINLEHFHDVNLGRAYQGLGISSRYLKNWGEAMFYTSEAANIFYKHKDMLKYHSAQVNIAVLLLDKLRFSESWDLLLRCYEIFEHLNDSYSLSKICEEFARWHFYNKAYDKTVEWSDRGVLFLRDGGTLISARLYSWKLFSYMMTCQNSLAKDSLLSVIALWGTDYEEQLQRIDPNIPENLEVSMKNAIKNLRIIFDHSPF